ncbi:MAG TPA: putative metal-dependent hydrolase [Ferruginibacter sp.]|nr:putative metal-dependent hydrolase [Ferruginibacter sp.]
MEDLRYPVGKYIVQPFSEKQLGEWLTDIKFLPQHLENAVLNLDEAQLNSPYREGGWTVKQVVHHVADSHMNAYIRFKLGLTEDNPTIKPYDEAAWAEMSDTKNLPINISLTILHALHTRWYEILKNMSRKDLDKAVFHPEHKKTFTLWNLLGMYAWHSRHHVAHITSLRERMKWE